MVVETNDINHPYATLSPDTKVKITEDNIKKLYTCGTKIITKNGGIYGGDTFDIGKVEGGVVVIYQNRYYGGLWYKIQIDDIIGLSNTRRP